MDNRMKIELMSKSKNESFARVAVAAFASQLDPTIEEIADIKTAVSEAVTNCIIHAYEQKEGNIYIYCGKLYLLFYSFKIKFYDLLKIKL